MNLLAPVPNAHAMPDEAKRKRREEAFKVGKDLLNELDVPADSYQNLAAMGNGGCKLDFASHGDLQSARSKVMTANKSYGNSTDGKRIQVFLDAGKTREELRPALLTHRCYDILHDLEQEKGDQKLEVQRT